MSKSTACVLLLFASVILASPALWSQTAYLVSDLHQQESNTDGIDPFESVLFQDRFFYAAYDPRYGEEPWISDGTPEGTHIFLDICPGPCSSEPRNYTVIDERLFFSAGDTAFGREPWTSDGTPEGTRLLRETVRGVNPSRSFGLDYAAVGQTLFFVVRDGQRVDLWSSDGTRRGTRRVTTLAQSNVVELQSGTDERLYFLLRTGYQQSELWTSDGTSEGTRQLVADCRGCSLMGNFADQLFFRREDAEHGKETWVSDGAPDGTRLLIDACPGSCGGDPLNFLKIGGFGFFTALDSERPRFSRSLFRTDGTAGGTQVALDSRSGNLIGVFNAIAGRDRIYFSTFDRQFRQGRIFTFDPADGTFSAVRSGFAALRLLSASDEHLYFVDARGTGNELWASDGTAAGTVRVAAPFETDTYLRSGILGLAPGDSRGFFAGFSQESGWELWTSDGTTSAMLDDLGIDPGSSSPRRLTRVGDQLVFVADLEDMATGVFTTDGTSGGTMLVDVGATEPGEIGQLGDELIYGDSTDDYRYGPGLWISDGTTGGTRQLNDELIDATAFVQAGDQVFFAAEIPGPETGRELWASDGTPEGTRLVRDINPGTQPAHTLPCCGNSSSPHELTALGSEILFAAADEVFGNNVELWKSDGTPEGTVMVADICPGPPTAMYGDGEPSGSRPSDLTLWNGRVYFAANDGQVGRELWASDGTNSGTERVTNLGLDAAGSQPHDLFVLGDKLYFFARRGRSESLWSTDGTAGGTERVHRLVHRRSATSQVASHRVVGEQVFFVSVSEGFGPELWVSDGTAAGTSLVVDLRRGRVGSYPESLTPLGDRVVFAADDGVSGRELWVSDGTVEGTMLLSDVIVGPESSSPAELFVDGALLYFSAATSTEGRELWAVEHGFEP